LCSSRKAARKGEWLQPAAAGIEHARDVLVGSENGRDLIPVEHFERRAARPPLAHPVLLPWQRGAAVDRVNPALSPSAAVDPVLGHEFEHEIRSRARKVDQAPSALCSEAALEVVRIELESRDYLTSIASGGSPARFRGLDEHDLGSSFGRVVGGRESREASTDHTEVGSSITRERRATRR
jgi:hypothetical protein